ncbi:TPA: hypothetical protein ACKRF3_000509 [Proteus mirabilis]
MSTIPTQNPVPSEAAKDLKFNSGKIDEFVTSMKNKYIDRFGQEHFTIEGLRWVAQQAISQFGYITLDSFQKGAEITLPNQVLRDEVTGEYYRWDGELPKSVPVNSTPDSSGGVGVGSWLSIGDAVLRSDLEKGRFNNEGTSIFFIPGINLLDENIDNRAAIYEFNGNVFIPKGITVRCNLLPEDDVTIFKGEGKILTRDPWGNEHIFDVYKANNGSDFSFSDILNQSIYKKTQIGVGCIGDSISDGAWGKQDWTSPPEGANRNLSSKDYNHSNNGGSHSWFNHFVFGMNAIAARETRNKIFNSFNCSLSGARLSDGWAYRNFDYGFFQNKAYGNSAPSALVIAMGWNDIVDDFYTYKDKLNQLIRKAWGYGCAISVVSVNRNEFNKSTLESSVKEKLSLSYKNIEYYDLGEYLEMISNANIDDANLFYTKKDGSFDHTHPQPIGHIAMASYMLFKVFHDKIYTVKEGMLFQPSSNAKMVEVVGLSGDIYSIHHKNAGGSPFLDKLRKISKIQPSNENVTFSFIVYCENNNTSLSIIEPWIDKSDFETYPTSANVSLFRGVGLYPKEQDSLNSYRTIYRQKIASAYMRDKMTLVTYVGKLHFGINLISITYGGNPSSVYVPILKFDKYAKKGVSFSRLSLNVKSKTVLKFVGRDNMLGGVLNGASDSFNAHFISSGDYKIYTTIIHKAPADGVYILVNYDELNDVGLAFFNDGGKVSYGEYSNKSVLNINKTDIVWSGELIIDNYQSSNESAVNTFSIKSGSSERSFSSSYSTGGSVGVYNSSDNDALIALSCDATIIN